MIVDDLKRKAMEAAKAGDTVARDILRLALGEIQTAEARGGAAVTDEQAQAAVKKLVKSNEETLSLSTDEAAKTTLERELVVLRALLPKGLSVDELVLALASQTEAIRGARADGQATGVAMKHLKTEGLVADGKDVTEAVKRMRA